MLDVDIIKVFIVIVITTLYGAILNAATLTAVQNGSWTVASTWDLNRLPADGDIVVIPAGFSVDFINTPYSQSNPVIRPTLTIKIYGTLDFSTPGNDKLYLDAGSIIEIYAGGKIQTTGSSTEIIAIYNGTSDNTVWTGNPNIINGPSYATGTTSGFSMGLLPIKLLSFTFEQDNGQAKLIWITGSEINSLQFEIERFNGDSGKWQIIGHITAAENSSVPVRYTYPVSLENGINEFRLKLVDKDGSYTYSPVLDIRFKPVLRTPDVIYKIQSHELCLTLLKNNIDYVCIYDVAGNLILKKSRPSGTIYFIPKVNGTYLVNTRSAGQQITKKVFFP